MGCEALERRDTVPRVITSMFNDPKQTTMHASFVARTLSWFQRAATDFAIFAATINASTAASSVASGADRGRGCRGAKAKACGDVTRCASQIGKTSACIAKGLLEWRRTAPVSHRHRIMSGLSAEEYIFLKLGPMSPARGMPDQAFAEAAATTGYQVDHLPHGRDECEHRRQIRKGALPSGQCVSDGGKSTAQAAWRAWRAAQARPGSVSKK